MGWQYPPPQKARHGWWKSDPGKPSIFGYRPHWELMWLVIMLVAGCGLGYLLTSVFSPRSTSYTPRVHTPTYFTATAQATATPSGPRPIGQHTVLGGSLHGFGNQPGWKPNKVGYSYDAHGLNILLTYTYFDGADFNQTTWPDVDSIVISPFELNARWYSDQYDSAAAAVADLLPSDAVHVTDDTSKGQGVAARHIYRSASLAATFPTSPHIIPDGNPPYEPGVFNWHCLISGSANDDPRSGIETCTIEIGR